MPTNLNIVKGTPPEKAWSKTWSPHKGFTYHRTIHATPDTYVAIVTNLRIQGYEVEWTEGPLYTIVASTPVDPTNDTGNSNVPYPVWELEGQDLNKDILDSNLPIVTSIGPKNIQILRNAMTHRPAAGQIPPFDTSVGVIGYGNALIIWANLNIGNKTVPVSNPVVRRSYVLNFQYAVDPSVNNLVNTTIITTNTFIANENLPAFISVGINNLPSGTSHPQPFVTLTYGWIKKYAKRLNVSATKVQFSQEWHFGQWSTLAFPTTV